MTFLSEPADPCELDPLLGGIVADLPAANAFREAADLVTRLRGLEVNRLHTESEQRWALAVVSFVGHSYIWQSEHGADSIPSALAVPWAALAARCHIPPVLTYSSYVLENQRILGAGDLVVPALSFTGGPDEAWFIHVHQRIEAAGARVVGLAVSEPPATELQAHACAATVADALEDMCKEARRMQSGCDPYIYFTRVRRYLYGWKWNPVFGDRKMTYEGVPASGLPAQGQYSGESGSQSPLIPLIDAILGVNHDAGFKRFADEMRMYMYPDHRECIRRGAALPLGRWAKSSVESRQEVARALELLHEFRSIHLDFARQYIVDQTARVDDHYATGTGGSDVIGALTGARDAVSRRIAQLGQ